MNAEARLPAGRITFLFTEIEESARLWERSAAAMGPAVARHDALAAALIARYGGALVKTRGEGDSLLAVFARAADAVAAACDLQTELLAEVWPPEASVRVRIALHTGEADLRDGDYYGPAVIRCARLRAAAHGGQVLLSEATRNAAAEALPPGSELLDLGLHRLRDLQEPERVFQLLHPALPAGFPPLRSLPVVQHNLPAQLTRFIGRVQEIAEVERRLTSARLLTLTGAGGCGKTRLALQVASGLVDAGPEKYPPDGIWLVELAGLIEPAAVARAVAAALGVREHARLALADTLVEHLRRRRFLLVLDNCEHLLSACRDLVTLLLQGCPHLRVLATSRELLGVAGEATYRVPSLSLPDDDERRTTGGTPGLLVGGRSSFVQSDAVRLFLDRAALSRAGFTLTAENAPVILQICRRLDGIPLALELAAARLRNLSVEQLAERLDDRFRLLTGVFSRTALPRQQTLRATIDWSYDLLTDAERALLRRLSVFAGGFTLEAAEAVCGEAILLAALVDKSLVQRDEGAARHRLLDTVRQYARERLAEAGEEDTIGARHAAWCLELAERAEPELFGREQQAWLARLDRERENLHAALLWSRQAPDPEPGLRLAGALWWFRLLRGMWQDPLLDALLAKADAQARTLGRAKALLAAGALARFRGESERAARLLEESLEVGNELGDELHAARSLLQLGALAVGREQYEEAARLCEESLARFRAMGDTWGVGRALGFLGRVASDLGEYARAARLLEESRERFQELGDRASIGDTLWRLAVTAERQGEFERAVRLHQESLALYREVDDRLGIARALCLLGRAACARGEYHRATTFLEEGFHCFQQLGGKRTLAWALELRGALAEQREAYEEARTHFSESLWLCREAEDRRGAARALAGLGRVALRQGELERAAALLQESLDLGAELGDDRAVEARIARADGLRDLGEVARRQGRPEPAAVFLRESLGVYRDLGERGGTSARYGIARCLARLASVAAMQGDAPRAARLLGAAGAWQRTVRLQGSLGSPLPPAERDDDAGRAAALRAALGEEAFETARAEGRALTLDAALTLADGDGGSERGDAVAPKILTGAGGEEKHGAGRNDSLDARPPLLPPDRQSPLPAPPDRLRS